MQRLLGPACLYSQDSHRKKKPVISFSNQNLTKKEVEYYCLPFCFNYVMKAEKAFYIRNSFQICSTCFPHIFTQFLKPLIRKHKI